MNLVLQHPHDKACKLACLAMLSGRSLAQVIEDAGTDKAIDEGIFHRLAARYGLEVDDSSYIATIFGDSPLSDLIRQNETLLCKVCSCVDPSYSHAVVIHKQTLYDPWHGINPVWPWDRMIGSVRVVSCAELREVNP